MDRKIYKNQIAILSLVLSTFNAGAQNIKPIYGFEYNSFNTFFNSIGTDIGITFKDKLEGSILYNYYSYYNSAQSKPFDKGIEINSLGLKGSYRPLNTAISPRIEASYSKGISRATDGTILGFSGYPTKITDSLSYLGKFESLRWSFKLGGGLDYSWRNFNVYMGMGYQWWEFNINRDFYHAYFTVGHRGLYYNARIAYRFGKKDKQE